MISKLRARTLADVLLPNVPLEYIAATYGRAPGNEIASGKFFNPESSACLVANAFGPFFNSPERLGSFPGLPDLRNVLSVEPETELRFPWRGGKHPCLDVLIETEDAVIGVESKRYEPFRSRDKPGLSAAYDRDVWGRRMTGYKAILAELRQNPQQFVHVDAAQLVKHAFALRSAVANGPRSSKRALLFYLHAQPLAWPDGRKIAHKAHLAHHEEIRKFADRVEGDEVTFHACTYRELLTGWVTTGDEETRIHAAAILESFSIG